MAELTKEQLIELITKEVLRTLGGGEPEEPPDKSGLPLALVIGPAEQLPKPVRTQYRLASIEEYQGDIEPYEKLFITAITRTQLADAALGRDSQPVTCALTNALLYGKEVYLYDIPLPTGSWRGGGAGASTSCWRGTSAPCNPTA